MISINDLLLVPIYLIFIFGFARWIKSNNIEIGILIAINIFDMLSINQDLWQVLFLETLVALSITIFISILSFRYFEKPFLKYKNKFSYIKK